MEEMQDMKVVMTQRGGKVTIGVHAIDHDPVIRIVPECNRLEDGIGRVGDAIAVARAQWERSPRYPKSEREMPKTPVRSASTVPSPAKAKPDPKTKPEEKLQKSLF